MSASLAAQPLQRRSRFKIKKKGRKLVFGMDFLRVLFLALSLLHFVAHNA